MYYSISISMLYNSIRLKMWTRAIITITVVTITIITRDIRTGANDTLVCSTPNDYILYFGTLRKVFDGDIVVALESGYSPEIKGVFYFGK